MNSPTRDLGSFLTNAGSSWHQMLPRCAFAGCPGRHPILNGILRRGDGIHCNGTAWYCSPDCMESALGDHFKQLLGSGPGREASPRLPLGLELISRGLLSSDQLRAGLDQQATRGGLLGECLRELGFVTEDQVTAAVASQWSCPVFPPKSIQPGCASVLPYALLSAYEMLPVHSVIATRTLYIGFARAINYTVLYAIEKMVGCKTEPCILPGSILSSLLAQAREQDTRDRVVVDFLLSPAEMAKMVRGYAQQLRSDCLRYAGCGKYLWVQVKGARQTVPLLFRTHENLQRPRF